jgi:hypothetical protein
MKKILLVSAFLLTFLIQANAQFGNEWINFSQSYFKIPVGRDALYKLTYADLQAAGFPVNSVDPQTIQLFHRGTEQAIYVEGESDTQFDPGDFLEFYGKRNDGSRDAQLYKPTSAQPHAYYSLYSDTTAYFLTYGAQNGKRMSFFSEANAGLPPETFHFDEKLLLAVQDFATGTIYGTDIQHTYFDHGEGWTGPMITQNQTRSYTFTDIVRGETAGGKPQLEILLVGRYINPHSAELYVGTGQRLVATASFNSTTAYKLTQDIEWSDIAADGSLIVSVKAVGSPDYLSVSYVKIRYPQTFDVAGAAEKVITLAQQAGGKSYLSLQNPPAAMQLFDITDPSDVVQIGTSSSSTLNAVVPNTTVSRKIFATNTTLTPAVHPVAFRGIIPSAYDYVLITHPVLRKPAPGYSDPVKAYASYRASATGGGFDTLLINIQDVYNQFNYGELSPLAIYNFMKYFAATKLPRYLLIVGKGLDVEYNYNRAPGNFSLYKDLIPSAGMPASDAYYTVGLGGTTYEPAVPTGRITASTPAHVAAYLDKVIEREALPFDALWRKNLLHLSGGIEDGEPERFKAYVQDFAGIATDIYLGGKVTAIAKRSKDVQLINIADEVNNGLNLVTFFGHSSANTLDFDIGYVTNPVMGYHNEGKYPMLLMHGCYAGAFFQGNMLFGEDWILAEKKGAVGFIAHSFYGLEHNLKRYGDTFYDVAFGDSTFIYKGIGDIHKETARRYMLTTSPSAANITQVQQMILLGDPAIPLFGARKPDLEINTNTVSFESFDGGSITALTDSFAIRIVVRNFGQARPDTLRIEVERVFNDNTSIVYDSLIMPVYYSDTLMFVIRKGHQGGAGNNVFNITVDADFIIDELNESNNTVSRSFFIPLNGTKNLFPRDFAIVNDQAINLSWQTTDVLSGERAFELELDTVNTFDSPYKKAFNVSGHVLARQSISLLADDTLAYYWRTRLADPLPGESEAWEETSFTYIEDGSEGWAQVHFPQYLKNSAEGLVTDASLRKLHFQETITDVAVKTFGANHPSTNRDVSVKIDGIEYNLFTLGNGGFGCRDNSINLMAFDRRSTMPYIGVPFKWYTRFERACGRNPWSINNFKPSELITGNGDDIQAYVNNIPAGDTVLIFSIGDAGYSAWPVAAKNKLGELGIAVAQLDALQPGEPVVIFGRKGSAPGSAQVFRASGIAADAQLDVARTITGRYTSGTMQSSRIGPALQWDSFQEQVSEQEAQDAASFDLVGVALDGAEQTLFTNVTGSQDLSGVDAQTYPYLKVVINTADDINLTSPQLDHWLVLYTPVPEGLVMFSGSSGQLLTEGQTWTGDYGFITIGETAFTDSLTVQYETFNHDEGGLETKHFRIKAPAPGDTTAFSIAVATSGRTGLNDVEVFVNPRVLPEQYYDNNVVALMNYLNVQPDAFNPVLDVSIDGRHLVNGDFVSPDPLMVVRLWDENRSLKKINTEGMRIFLTYPCDTDDCDPELIDLTAEEIKWFPATDTSDFKIEFRPATLPEGTYTLRVEGADARGNSSGTAPYEVDFVVKEETTVAVLPPYPNPFNTEVYFTVVLSGSALPSGVSMQIVDVTGKLVRQFSPGDIHIGTNEWRWDGTDHAGNILPKGVYIYKLFFAVGSKEIQRNGKVVLVR